MHKCQSEIVVLESGERVGFAFLFKTDGLDVDALEVSFSWSLVHFYLQ